LEWVSGFVDGVGPKKSFFADDGVSIDLAQSRLEMATSRGLAVHPWTFREVLSFSIFDCYIHRISKND